MVCFEKCNAQICSISCRNNSTWRRFERWQQHVHRDRDLELDCTTFSEVPKKCLMRRCCLIHSKDSSTCQRETYNSQMVKGANVIWQVKNMSRRPSAWRQRMRRMRSEVEDEQFYFLVAEQRRLGRCGSRYRENRCDRALPTNGERYATARTP